MARRKKEEAPAGSPAWMATFSDLMNLLLCFFVLLFSMSTVDIEKFEQVIASLQSSISILPSGGSTIEEGSLISSGVTQLDFLDAYYKEKSDSESDKKNEESGSIAEKFEEESLEQSESMYEDIKQEIEDIGIAEGVELNFTSNYVKIDLSGAILFRSGYAELIPEVTPMMDSICKILDKYSDHYIEIEGHTDNVPMTSGRYENNDVLSMYRALCIANYIREHTSIEPSHIKSSGRGEYVPIADNSTAEGRARNRRVEIKIYNSFSMNN